ncbi:MAG: type II toxin-antitoxin system PemK/MazF family toxin [Saprospiraceae bacterium]|nr:type II toxin-antitoxin system PemK/MazF family toxin [Saprospiraceae bacterium]
MILNKYEIWLANLDPGYKTEPGKTRPVLIVQNNLLNELGLESTLVCPLTSKLSNGVEYLRVRVKPEISALDYESDILIDQIRAINNSRFIRKIGDLPQNLRIKVDKRLKIVLDLDPIE